MREGFRVVGPDGKPMPELFREIRRDRSQVEIEGMTSGGRATVHCTRIISSKKEEIMATKKVSGTPKFDFKTIAGERWSKPMAFDHKGVKAEAHVIVNRITKKYRAFNTYNGSLGKQGKTGMSFAFKDYNQLVARLAERGYKRIGGGPAPKKETWKKAAALPKSVQKEKGPVTVIPKVKPAPAPAPAPAPKEAPNANVPAAPAPTPPPVQP